MGLPCALSPFGLWRCGGTPSIAEGIYKALVAQITDPKSGQPALDLTQGGYQEAKYFATAIALGFAEASLHRAAAQGRTRDAVSGLASLESEFLATPDPRDGIVVRQNRLVAAEKAYRGAAFESVVDALRTLLGADFVAYVPHPATTVYPTDPGASAQVNAVRPGLVPKFLQLVDPIAAVNAAASRWVRYSNLDPTAGETDLAAGDVVMVQPDNTDVSEKVTVLAVRGSGAARDFQAVFANAHDIGAVVTTMSWPWQFSQTRVCYIVLKAAAASSVVKRAAIDALMPKLLRMGSQWSIVRDDIGSVPFTLGQTPLGTAPVVTFGFTPSP